MNPTLVRSQPRLRKPVVFVLSLFLLTAATIQVHQKPAHADNAGCIDSMIAAAGLIYSGGGNVFVWGGTAFAVYHNCKQDSSLDIGCPFYSDMVFTGDDNYPVTCIDWGSGHYFSPYVVDWNSGWSAWLYQCYGDYPVGCSNGGDW